jgi:hypothetical protein
MFGKKNYETIVAPLKKVKSNLSIYVNDQKKNISGLEETKKQINVKIDTADKEIKKSGKTLTGIEELIVNNSIKLKDD